MPVFFVPAGARFSVMRLTGKRKPLFLMAARTRSRDSRTAASGRPTSSKPGRPLEMLHSTMTGQPLMPDRPTESTREVIRSPSFFPLFFIIQHRPQKYKRRRAKAVSDSGRICIHIDLRKILQKTRANKHANKHELFSAFDAGAPRRRLPRFFRSPQQWAEICRTLHGTVPRFSRFFSFF